MVRMEVLLSFVLAASSFPSLSSDLLPSLLVLVIAAGVAIVRSSSIIFGERRTDKMMHLHENVVVSVFCLSVCSFVYLSICLSACLSVYTVRWTRVCASCFGYHDLVGRCSFFHSGRSPYIPPCLK